MTQGICNLNVIVLLFVIFHGKIGDETFFVIFHAKSGDERCFFVIFHAKIGDEKCFLCFFMLRLVTRNAFCYLSC